MKNVKMIQRCYNNITKRMAMQVWCNDNLTYCSWLTG